MTVRELKDLLAKVSDDNGIVMLSVPQSKMHPANEFWVSHITTDTAKELGTDAQTQCVIESVIREEQ